MIRRFSQIATNYEHDCYSDQYYGRSNLKRATSKFTSNRSNSFVTPQCYNSTCHFKFGHGGILNTLCTKTRALLSPSVYSVNLKREVKFTPIIWKRTCLILLTMLPLANIKTNRGMALKNAFKVQNGQMT